MQRQVKLLMRRPTPVAILLGLVVIAGCASVFERSGGGASSTPAVPPGLSGRLLYTRDGGLWTLVLQNAEARQIVPAPELGQVTAARWSPDGARVAYAFAEVRNRRVPVSEIRVSAADGSSTQTLLSSEGGVAFGSPTWAPDGASLYLSRTGLEQGQRVRRIERLDLATGASEPVFNDVAPFDVSPDGRWLAIARAGNLGQSILLVDLTSAEERTIVPEREFDTIAAPRFAPTSNQLLFSAAALVAQAPPGSSPAGFALGLFDVGRAMAHGLPQDVYAAPLAGGRPIKVAALSADEPVVAPSPDGTQLAIFSADALATVPVGGGRLTPLLTPGGYGTVDWAK
jgi:Tol biopolymer transport system component